MFYIIWEFIRFLITTCFLMLAFAFIAKAQTSSFTYQGKLTENSAAANGSYRMQFALYDAASAQKELLLYGTLNTGFSNFSLSYCSSRLRYKTNIAPFDSGLSLVDKLKPITFDWKMGGGRDLGLGAEDVAAVEPLLVNYNREGQIEGVKYDRLGVVLLNAVKEQQAQIRLRQKQIEDQRAVIDGLKRLVCAEKKTAEICR